MNMNVYYIMTPEGCIEEVENIQTALLRAQKSYYVICDQGPGNRMVWASGNDIEETLRKMTHTSPAQSEQSLEKIVINFLQMDFIYWSLNPATERLHSYVSNFSKQNCRWPQCSINEKGLADLV